MPVYSHSRKNKDGTREGSKYLFDHLEGVKEKALLNFSGRLAIQEAESAKSLLETVCWLHDLGKYTSYFQTYLLEPGKVSNDLKSHSALGAHAAFNYLKHDTTKALLAYYLIKLHHSNLLNFDKVLWPDFYNERKRGIIDTFDKQVQNLNNFGELKNQFPGFDISYLKFNEPKKLYNDYKKELEKADSIEHYFIVNYLFSLLIESDKLDASDTSPYSFAPLPQNAVDDRKNFGKPTYPDRELKTFTQNELRNFVRAEVVKNVEREDILEKRIFTLAAPTGIGKTMTALDFALKLRKKIELQEGYIPQIIYGLPFINIIEQALQEYEVTLGEGKILGHYQYADVFGSDVPEQNNLDDKERFYSQKKMSWDTWQSDIVITSFVQLFETLIGNRNKLLKKFHHFADSIIILDEVQTLAIEKLPVIGAALYYLSKFLNARIIIMTATQPKLFELMNRELMVQIDDINLKPFNLLTRDAEVFACFNRTKVIPVIENKMENEDFIDFFDSRWTPDKSCLIVVNKVSRSIEIFDLLSEHLNNSGVELFYLSTNITPIERKQRIEQIKQLLPNKTCILVSTQVVEAGVDLDFDMGIRDLGPIDSIVQVAGRINRENSKERKGSPLYIIDFGDCQRIYGHATESKARQVLSNDEISEENYKELVEKYFDSVSDETQAEFKISKEVFRAMKQLRYADPNSSGQNKDLTVSDFKIIENSNQGVSVFVELPHDIEGTEARKAYEALLKNEMPRHVFDSKFKRAFHQRIIAVPDYLPNTKELIKGESRLSENILWIKPDVSEYYYAETTGFIRTGEKESLVMF
jgi:CRISPR-associated endonuclease/helicase Cas3